MDVVVVASKKPELIGVWWSWELMSGVFGVGADDAVTDVVVVASSPSPSPSAVPSLQSISTQHMPFPSFPASRHPLPRPHFWP
jgi:hypothetical protein